MTPRARQPKTTIAAGVDGVSARIKMAGKEAALFLSSQQRVSKQRSMFGNPMCFFDGEIAPTVWTSALRLQPRRLVQGSLNPSMASKWGDGPSSAGFLGR